MNAATDEQENVNELKFGALNFDKVQSLTQDEMFFLLAQRQQSGLTNELFDSTYAYLEKVASSRDHTALENLTMELGEKLRGLKLQRVNDSKLIPLHAYEVASLANLIKDEDATVEEMLSLVPSLSRFPDDQIEIAINIVVEAKARASGETY
eukprot:gene9851-10897_t